MKLYKIWLLAILLIGFTACESDDDTLADPEVDDTQTVDGSDPVFTSGSADFSTFVAIGNSLTAGFSDGALFMKGQKVSFPNLLAQRFALAGGGTFTQPLMNDDVGGLLLGGSPVLNPITGDNVFPPRLIFDAANQAPISVGGMSSTDFASPNPGPYNNMGVPGAKSFHLLAPGYGNIANFPAAANPYFIRMASSPNASMLEDALAQNPTFFSLWIGNNDVLGYATSGGDGSNPITDQATFDGAMTALVASLTANNAKGIISNIPNVTDAAYFNTVPFAPLSPLDPNFGPQIPTLNGIFGQLNQVFAFLESQGVPNATERQIVFSQTAASAVVIKDESLADLSLQIAGVLNASPTFPAFVESFGLPAAAAPIVANLLGSVYGQARQANANDLIVLPSSSVIGTVNEDQSTFLQGAGLPEALADQFSVEGISLPLEDKWVVIPTELTEIQDATIAFNQTIENLATQFDIALFDVNAFFNVVASSGFQAGSAFMTADYVTGGTFSLDGIHPSPRGNAVVVNQMIDIINTKYGSNLPTINPVDYTGVYLD
ncbi:G-D-S-L family lipolytic protein [Psychroserpens sp. MEBiC05023]